MAFSGEHRDFTATGMAVHEQVLGVELLAWDGSHRAVLAKISALAPAQGNIQLRNTMWVATWSPLVPRLGGFPWGSLGCAAH